MLTFLLWSVISVSQWPLRPDHRLTPGDVFPNVTAAQVCTSGYAGSMRHVTEATKRDVFRRYHLSRADGSFEVDHLDSLELGGTNDIKNLWIQSYTTQPWNAHDKDLLEGRLHYLVCHNRLDLKVAQDAITLDWIAAYQLYMPVRKL